MSKFQWYALASLGCLENKYFPRDLIFGAARAGKNATEPSGTACMVAKIGSVPRETLPNRPPNSIRKKRTKR
jgi:hypothetical protein